MSDRAWVTLSIVLIMLLWAVYVVSESRSMNRHNIQRNQIEALQDEMDALTKRQLDHILEGVL